VGGLGPPRPGGLAIRGLVTAVRFLTIVPVPGRALEGADALGRAAAWFPLVGLALGGLLWLLNGALTRLVEPSLSGVFVLMAWKLLTGGIHLDGLADSLDGLAGKDRAERLAIMRDGRIGTYGALGLVFVLLTAYAVLANLVVSTFRAPGLVLAPAVGRLGPLLLARTFLPAAGGGSGAAFMGVVSWKALALGAIPVGAASVALSGAWGLLIAAVGLAVAWAAAGFFSRRLGGLTGDVLGAAVELAELAVLVVYVAYQFSSIRDGDLFR